MLAEWLTESYSNAAVLTPDAGTTALHHGVLVRYDSLPELLERLRRRSPGDAVLLLNGGVTRAAFRYRIGRCPSAGARSRSPMGGQHRRVVACVVVDAGRPRTTGSGRSPPAGEGMRSSGSSGGLTAAAGRVREPARGRGRARTSRGRSSPRPKVPAGRRQAPASSADSASPVKRKMLVVDDGVRNVLVLTSVLERHGLQVLHAESGREGIEGAGTARRRGGPAAQGWGLVPLQRTDGNSSPG